MHNESFKASVIDTLRRCDSIDDIQSFLKEVCRLLEIYHKTEPKKAAFKDEKDLWKEGYQAACIDIREVLSSSTNHDEVWSTIRKIEKDKLGGV